MMISDKERREVARKLREVTEEELCHMFLGEILGCFIGGYCLNEEGGLDERLVLNRLADLIVPQPIDGDTSDGYHTFNELYHHRAVLFSVIVENFAARAWKSKLHADGTMYEGMFIVGIETPDGQATYHYDVEPYWNLFRCKEVDRAPEWDGHTPDQAIERIGKLVDCKTDRPTCKTIEHQTCTIESIIFHDEYNEYEVELSCGDSIRWVGTAEDIAFCPIGGAKVIK